MMILRTLLAFALAFLPLAEASAGSGTITTKDAAGVTRTFVVTTDGSGNFLANGVLCDGTAGASCLTITGGKALVTPDLPSGASTAALQSTGNNSLGTIITNLGSPFQAGGSIGNTTFAVTQATAANLNATVVGTGTFAVQAASTLAAETTKVIGTVRNLGNAGAIFDGATGAAVPANVLYLGMNQGGNLAGLTGTSGSLNVNITGGGGSGGTSSNFGSTFPSAGTAIGLTNGTNMVAWSATTTYGTAPAAIAVPAVNAFITNATALGQAALASSSPVAVAKNSGTGSTIAGAAVGTAGSASAEVVTVQGVSSMTPLAVSRDTTANSATHGLYSNLLQGDAVLSATNGVFANVLQGNAVLSATNGSFANILQGNAVLSVSNPSFNRSVAGASGGGTISSAIAPATPAGVNLKGSAGSVFRVFATTVQATPVYIKFYNASSAPTCGSGTPVARFMVPVAATAANGAGTNIDIGDMGAAFGTGIGYCVTGALADNDTTAITANNTLVNIVWN